MCFLRIPYIKGTPNQGSKTNLFGSAILTHWFNTGWPNPAKESGNPYPCDAPCEPCDAAGVNPACPDRKEVLQTALQRKLARLSLPLFTFCLWRQQSSLLCLLVSIFFPYQQQVVPFFTASDPFGQRSKHTSTRKLPMGPTIATPPAERLSEPFQVFSLSFQNPLCKDAGRSDR